MLHLLQKRTKTYRRILKDSIAGNKRYLKLNLSNRAVNRYDIFANKKMVFYDLKLMAQLISIKRTSLTERKKLLSYYVVDNAL
jgi:hypothetical protein